ncbi:hypothetical protein V6N13_074548 [Hibiscus sabdariffa]|uniref:Uncharacterized protein n=1 Tax=Hibiscus sabdariffa TaxID=183260 RepID=A0ABR2U8W1_9ROSI
MVQSLKPKSKKGLKSEIQCLETTMEGSEKKREGNSIVLLLCWFCLRNDEWKNEDEMHMQRVAMDNWDEEEKGEY